MLSHVVKHVIEKFPYNSLDLLNSGYVVAFDVETGLENTKLAILEQLELKKKFFAPFSFLEVDKENSLVFYRNQNVIYVIE